MNGIGSIAFVVFRSMRIQATLGGTFVSIVILLHLRDGAAQINVPRSGFTIYSSMSPSLQVRHVMKTTYHIAYKTQKKTI